MMANQMQHPRSRLNHIFLLLLLTASPALARDPDGRYATSPLHDWFNHLASQKGLCCSLSDGQSIAEVDWRSSDGHYQVRLGEAWIDVPDEAVITEPNLDGRTWVWPLTGIGGLTIRCFMPGSMG